MLLTRNLRYTYPGGPDFAFPDLEVSAGERVLLLGPSGSGKSTWLHLLAGVLTPTGGSLELDGRDYAQLRGGTLDRFRGEHIGIVFQRAYFIESLSVEENLAVAQGLGKGAVNRPALRQTLDDLGIGQYRDRSPLTLSVGEQQRVTIARALVTKPRLLLADEPTSALDHRNARRVSRLLCAQPDRNSALIVVTHDERIRDDYDKIIELP